MADAFSAPTVKAVKASNRFPCCFRVSGRMAPSIRKLVSALTLADRVANSRVPVDNCEI